MNRGLVNRIACVAGLAGLLYGFDMGIIAGALQLVRDTFHLSTRMQEWVVSSVLVGSTIGAVTGGVLSDRFGRRRTMLWGGITFCLGSVLAPLAPNVGVLVAARLTLGLAIGFTSVTAPVYVSELAPSQVRGRLIALYQLALTLGIAAADLVGLWFSDSFGWRWMFGIGLAPAVLFVAAILGVPESPRWLLMRGRRAEAKELLSRLWGESTADVFLSAAEVQQRSSAQLPWRMLFNGQARKALVIAAGFTFLQQVTGVNTLIYYGPRIFALAGIASNHGAIFATLLVALVNVLCTVLALAFVDRLGRKPLLYGGVTGMAVCLFTLAFCFRHQQALSSSPATIALVCLLAYMACFALSMGPIAWILVAEVFPGPLRSRGAAAATLSSGLANTLVSATFLSLVHWAGLGNVFGLYGCLCLVTLLFTAVVIPETSGRELEQISGTHQNPAGFNTSSTQP